MGFATTIVLGILFSVFISPLLQQTIVNKYPEMSYISNELIKNYPDAEFGINIASTKSLSGQSAGVTTSTLTVSVMSNRDLSSSDRKQIGEKVCNLLEQHNDSYTNVEVAQVTVKKMLFLPIKQSFTEGRTCKEWNENPPYELPEVSK